MSVAVGALYRGRKQRGDLDRALTVALAELAEGRRRRELPGQGVLLGHRGAVGGDLGLVVHILLREAERFLEQKQRREGVPAEGRIEELLADRGQVLAVGEHSGPFGVGEGG